MARAHVRNRFGRTPRKGTKTREVLLMMLRPQGAASYEIDRLFGKGFCAAAIVRTLRDDKGWDVRTFSMPRSDSPHQYGRLPVVHKVVGKMKWDGSYRSFVKGGEDVQKRT